MTTHTHSTLEKEIENIIRHDDLCYFDQTNECNCGNPEKVKEIMQLLVKHEEERNNSEYIAFCECGDALERKDLYPSKATYYCMGCDKTYILTKNSKGEEK